MVFRSDSACLAGHESVLVMVRKMKKKEEERNSFFYI